MIRSRHAQIGALKRRLVSWAKPEDFEIKGRDLRRGDKLFVGQDWATRVKAFHEIAQVIADLSCEIIAVQVAKQHLPEAIAAHDQMYRLAFTRLLEAVDAS